MKLIALVALLGLVSAKDCAASCKKFCKDDKKCYMGCMKKCKGKEEEEEMNMQLKVCRKKCNTTNVFSPCVVSCKAKQTMCSATCGGNPICITKCVLREEEEEQQLENSIPGLNWAKCMADCPNKMSCWAKCAMGGKEEEETELKDCAASCKKFCKDDKKCYMGCMKKCKGKEEEMNMQLGICRNKCGSDSPWNMCVVSCKAQQMGCAAQCGGMSNVGCITKCMTSEEEEENMQIGICRNKCGTDSPWNMCVAGCKAQQMGCAAQCGGMQNVGCITKCMTSEEEEMNMQVGICRNKCGTESPWNMCVVSCKAQQMGCAAQCGGMTDIGCISKCMTSEEEYQDFEMLI